MGSLEMLKAILTAMADAIVDRLEHGQDSKRRVLNVEQAAEYMGMSESGVYGLVADGKPKSVHLTRRTQFDIRDLDN